MRHQPLHRKSKGRRVNPPLLSMALSKPLSCNLALCSGKTQLSRQAMEGLLGAI